MASGETCGLPSVSLLATYAQLMQSNSWELVLIVGSKDGDTKFSTPQPASPSFVINKHRKLPYTEPIRVNIIVGFKNKY